MRRTPALTAAVVAAATLATAAQAGLPASARTLMAHRESMTATTQLRLADRTAKHARDVLGFLSNNPTAGTRRSRGRVRRASEWLLSFALREHDRASSRLRPTHYALWSCITNGAYPRAPHEGDGYNGSFVGPLGMTTPWEGHYPTGSDWVHTPVATVYAFAEAEYQSRLREGRGYAISWLERQWPQTSPPCMAYA